MATTLNDLLAAMEWPMFEKGLGRYMTPLRAFANAAGGSGITGVTTFGALDLSDAADVAQAATGATGITPVPFGFANSGAGRVPGSTGTQQPNADFRR